MEKKLEKVTMHKGGRTMVIEIVEDKSRYEGKRAYIPGDSRYWDMDQLDTAVAGCDLVERVIL